MLSVSLIRLYLRIRSLAVLEVRDGEALTYEEYTGRRKGICSKPPLILIARRRGFFEIILKFL